MLYVKSKCENVYDEYYGYNIIQSMPIHTGNQILSYVWPNQ